MGFREIFGSDKTKAKAKARRLRNIFRGNTHLPELPERLSEEQIADINDRFGKAVLKSAFANGASVVQVIDGKILRIDPAGNKEILGEKKPSTETLPSSFRLA